MPSEITDTHCHIQSIGKTTGDKGTRERWQKAGFSTPDSVVEDAKAAGVTRLLCVGCDLVDSELAVDFVKNRGGCWASIGLHPHEAKHFVGQPELLKRFSSLIKQDKVVAVGECGLDYYYEHSPKKDQQEILRYQLGLAKSSNLPLIFHVREAFDDFWPIFEEFSGLSGVLHSYTDTDKNLERALSHGLYLGVNGIATFTKDQAQLGVIKTIPLEKLLLETDAPFLTPGQYRGNINQPKYLGEVVNFLAELRGESRDQLAAATTRNARQLFGF